MTKLAKLRDDVVKAAMRWCSGKYVLTGDYYELKAAVRALRAAKRRRKAK